MFAGRLKKGLAQGLLKHPQTLLTLNTTNAALFHAQSAVLSKKILISDPIEDSCVDILESAGYSVTRTEKVPPAELVEMIKDYDGIIVRSGTTVTADVINAGDKLKLIGRAGTGVDNIDVDAATKKGQMVMNTPGGNTQSTAELSVSMLMSLSRNIPMADASLKSGRWDRKKYSGTELSGKTLGIVGLGQIGRRVAEMCQGLGMTTIGYDPILSPEVAAENKIELVSLDELYPRADFITIHTPLTSDTRKMFNDETFAKCKDTLRIVNCARGGIIDEQALLRALEAGTVAGAALDVYETEPPPAETKPVLEHPLVVCTPHLGASTAEAQEKVAQEIAQSFVDAFEGRRISGVVNSKILAELASRKDLHPYVDLSERMGSLQAQLIFGNLKHIEIETVGQTLKGGTGILMAALLKGVLSQMIEESVNLINAPHLAAEFGIKVTEKHTHSAKHLHGNNIKVTFKTDKGTRSLTGIVDRTGTPRLVEVDKFQMHLDLEGHSLFWSNIDKPGCISRITSILGENSVNISSFSLGRESIGGRAIGVLNVDSAVNDDVIDQLTCTGDLIYSVHTYLPPLGTEAADDADGSKPTARPNSACFGSGPVKKFPGYDFAKLPSRNLGRSHRSALGLDTLQQVIGEQARLLKIPRDYYVGIVPASDTGAFETAMWSMLGQRPVDICYWDSFGKGWYTDAVKELKLDNIREFKADYGELPDLTKTNADHDIVFTWNGTTSGVKVPDGGWISADRKGLTFCDATSAVFAMDMPWDKLDVTTWSWQKALGGEGAHGMLVLSPRAVERLNTYTPAWPLPKLFRLTKNGKFCDDVFTGKVINTPSMLAVEDALLALDWVDSIGGLESMKSISEANLHVVEEFVEANEWIHFLAQDKTIRSNTSVCLTLDLEPAQVKELVKLLESENVAYDIGAYRDAPPGLRIWCGSTVETADVAVLMEWLKWAYNEVRNDAKEAGAQQE